MAVGAETRTYDLPADREDVGSGPPRITKPRGSAGAMQADPAGATAPSAIPSRGPDTCIELLWELSMRSAGYLRPSRLQTQVSPGKVVCLVSESGTLCRNALLDTSTADASLCHCH